MKARTVLSWLWVRRGAGGPDIPCPPGFLLGTKIAGIIGHRMHVFAVSGHFYASYSDGGTLGYPIPLCRPAPGAKQGPRFRSCGS